MACIHYGPRSCPMLDGCFSRLHFLVIFMENAYFKALGPSLGVYQM
jgi:hypothetical protein